MSAYGDTDSFLPPWSSYKIALSRYPQIFGEKLGLLADEIGGGKIIRGWFISPKVYMVEYITPDLKLKWKIRAKGIPRANKEIDVLEYNSKRKSVAEYIEWHAEDRLTRPLFGYMTGNILRVSDVLDDNMFEAMRHDVKVMCFYGTMKRVLTNTNDDNTTGKISFTPHCHRTINSKDWWSSGVRSNPRMTQMYSVPEGHFYFSQMNKQ
jgi:hypothetical protein